MLNASHYTTLLFDLDGTITDSGEGIMRCAQHALGKMGIDIPDYTTLRPFIGPPLEDSFKEFFNMSDVDAAKAVEAYRERYFSTGVYEQQLYEGVEIMLNKLKTKGYRLIIATSKTKQQAEFVVRQFGLANYFDFIGGRDEEGTLHTKADVIRYILKEMELTAEECLMIGDRKFDIEGAQECSIKSIGVMWGYGSREEFEKAGADHIINSIEELTQSL